MISEKLKCKWMSLELGSPYVLASLTMVSNVTLLKHVEYYKKAYDMGVGAIVLPSINPKLAGNPEENKTIADCLTFDTGLNSHHRMGFAVLGPTAPNIISLDYGCNLAYHVKKHCSSIPILGSIAKIGTEQDIIAAVQRLIKIGVDGIELNFSCPNVIAKRSGENNLTIELLRKIRMTCDLPISLKITPYQDYSNIIANLDDEIHGLTLSNAYIGLIPPNIYKDNCSPFDSRTQWAPSGVYGPFERMLTFKQLFDYQQLAEEKGLSLACVGGIVSAHEGIQAIMLGADVVQLSSAVLWHGLHIFGEFNNSLQNFIDAKGFNGVNQIHKTALPYIGNHTDALITPITRKMRINNEKCRKCKSCYCCSRLCIAISQNTDGSVIIDKELCSGCQMCRYLCPNSAIEE